MTREEFKMYVDSIKDTEQFKSLDDFIQMTRMAGKDIYEKIEKYLSMYCARTDVAEHFQPSFEYFKMFMENYLKATAKAIGYNEEGRIDLANTLHLVQPFMYCPSDKKGFFFDGWIMLTDGSKYICKQPLHYSYGKSGIRSPYSVYSSIIASQIAKQLGVETAEYILGRTQKKDQTIMSKNFLKNNEEMFCLEEDDEEKEEQLLISYNLKVIEEQLRNRRFSSEEIESTKLQFLKQEFVAKLIGLKDQNFANSPIITGVDEQGKKYVKMAPMLDYDYSFHIADIEYIGFQSRISDNGKVDICSFIAQYRDYPNFREFLEDSIKKFNMEEVFNNIYEQTGMPEFKAYREDPKLMRFISFTNENMELARREMAKEPEQDRGEI